MTLEALEVPAPQPPAARGRRGGRITQALLDRIKTLEQRLADLESSTVLSEPGDARQADRGLRRQERQRDRRAGARRHEDQVTYQRERVYRRQTISEKIEEALADAEEHSVKVGVSAAIAPQFAHQNRGEPTDADGHAYQLASADLFFTAGLAQYTSLLRRHRRLERRAAGRGDLRR